MNTALYYPHTNVRKVGLMKSALLLWDQVKYLCPNDFIPAPYEDSVLAKAAEIVMRKHPPTEAEKIETHNEVMRLLSSPLPD